MALQLHYLHRIVNVNWGGGLAVDFGDHAQDAPKPREPPIVEPPAKR